MNNYLLRFLAIVLCFLPSRVKVPIYRWIFGYQIGKHVKIGLSYINVGKLTIGDYTIIRHLTRIKNIPEVVIGEYCIIGNGNTFTSSNMFTNPECIARHGNKPRLTIGKHSGIALCHYIDVQDSVFIGSFTNIAGKGSVFFTHYIDIKNNTQSCKPITIGDYCMLGSSVKFAPGAKISNYCVVGIGSVVTKPFKETHCLIAGNPASIIRKLSEEALYFRRSEGRVTA